MNCEEILSAVTGVAISELNDDVTRTSIPQWDSLAHINLITAVEEAFGVSFSIDEIQQISTLGELKQLLKQKGVIC